MTCRGAAGIRDSVGMGKRQDLQRSSASRHDFDDPDRQDGRLDWVAIYQVRWLLESSIVAVVSLARAPLQERTSKESQDRELE